MRIGIAHIASETSTFCPTPTDMEAIRAFGWRRGQEVLQDFSYWSSVAGFLDVAGNEQIVGLLTAEARPSGYLTEDAAQTILACFREELERALPLDGLLINLHGAFASLLDTDFEGLVLETARTLVGKDTLIGAVLDLHGNVTMKKIVNADLIDGYHTHPHVDFRETGQRVARTLLATLRGEVRPAMSAVKIPMIPSCELNLTDEYPLKELIAETRRQENDPRVLLSSVFTVQPYLDIPEMGWASVVVTDGDPQLADQLARRLAQIAWDQREGYIPPRTTYAEALDEAFATDVRPIVVADYTDLTGGGGTGDSTWYLKDLLRRNPTQPCYLTMVDPEAVHQMAAAGEGATVTLLLGGKQDNINSTPARVTGSVMRLIPPAPDRQLPKWMGLAAVLKIDNIYVVVSEAAGPGHMPIVYSGAGLDPTQAKILLAKSIVDFREGFKPVGKRFIMGEAPGVAPSDLRSLEWKTINRPIFPLDLGMAWNGEQAAVYRSARSGLGI
jgi:microcystin degradation protein MlrC